MESNGDSETPSGKSSRGERKTSLDERVETVLEDLLSWLFRLLRTVIVLSFRPGRVLANQFDSVTTARVFVTPHTFLLVGCLLYSYFLAAGAYLTESTLTSIVWSIVRTKIGEVFSLQAVLIATLPLLIGASLAAWLSGVIFKNSGPRVRILFVYLYGLQGIVLILFAISVTALSKMFLRLLGDDDYIPLIFIAVILGAGLQGFRCLRFLTQSENSTWSLRRFFGFLAFPLFYLLPMPLIGFGLVSSGLIEEVTLSERPVPAVRIIDAEWRKLDDSRFRVSLTAEVENRSKQVFVTDQNGVEFALYFVPSDQEENIIFAGRSHQKVRPFSDLDYFDVYAVSVKHSQIETDFDGSKIRALAPGSAAIMRLTATCDFDGVAYFSPEQGRRQTRERRKRVESTLAELADGRTLLVRVFIIDRTLEQIPLTSGYSVGSDYYTARLSSNK